MVCAGRQSVVGPMTLLGLLPCATVHTCLRSAEILKHVVRAFLAVACMPIRCVHHRPRLRLDSAFGDWCTQWWSRGFLRRARLAACSSQSSVAAHNTGTGPPRRACMRTRTTRFEFSSGDTAVQGLIHGADAIGMAALLELRNEVRGANMGVAQENRDAFQERRAQMNESHSLSCVCVLRCALAIALSVTPAK